MNNKMIQFGNKSQYNFVNKFLVNYAMEKNMFGEIDGLRNFARYKRNHEIEIFLFDNKIIFKGYNEKMIGQLENDLKEGLKNLNVEAKVE